jgi:hypothetical protein
MKLAGVVEVAVLTVVLLALMARATQKRLEIDMRDRVGDPSDANRSRRVA